MAKQAVEPQCGHGLGDDKPEIYGDPNTCSGGVLDQVGRGGNGVYVDVQACPDSDEANNAGNRDSEIPQPRCTSCSVQRGLSVRPHRLVSAPNNCTALDERAEPFEILLEVSAKDWAQCRAKVFGRPVQGQVDVVGEFASGRIEGGDLAATFDLSAGATTDETVGVATSHGHGRVVDHGGAHRAEFFMNDCAGLGWAVGGWGHFGQTRAPFEVEGVVGDVRPHFIGWEIDDRRLLVADWFAHVLVFLALSELAGMRSSLRQCQLVLLPSEELYGKRAGDRCVRGHDEEAG